MTPEVLAARKAIMCLYLEVHEAIADDVRTKVIKAFESIEEHIVIKCKDELLKHMIPMTHNNGYPSMAIPQATIISLPNLIKLSKDAEKSNSERNSED